MRVDFDLTGGVAQLEDGSDASADGSVEGLDDHGEEDCPEAPAIGSDDSSNSSLSSGESDSEEEKVAEVKPV